MTVKQALTYLSQLNDNKAKEIINVIEDLQAENEKIDRENTELLAEKLWAFNDKLNGITSKNELFEENEQLHKKIAQQQNEIKVLKANLDMGIDQLKQADREIELLKAQQRWIPISEKSPNNKELVLCSILNNGSKSINIYGYTNDTWHDINGYVVVRSGILAWQPLPGFYIERKEVEVDE